MKISVCIPTYKGIKYLPETLDTIFSQTYDNFELVVCNDSQEDENELRELLSKYESSKINFYQNKENLGYPLNLKKCVEKSSGEILFLMGQDDLLLQENIFEKAISIFEKYQEVGVITRPYYWFEDDVNSPIRYIPKYHKRIIKFDSDVEKEDVIAVMETVGQLSALVYKKDLISHSFDENVFTAHIYPFFSVMRTHAAYYWEDFNLAVRTSSSQTRFRSDIYSPSPTRTWAEMFKEVFPEEKFEKVREVGIEHVAKNYLGLIQIKNYGLFKDLLFDIYYLVKYRPLNLVTPKFWFFTLGVLLTPRGILRRMVDYYKNRVNKESLEDLLN